MSFNPIWTGAQSYLEYGITTTDSSGNTTTDWKTFGVGTKITSLAVRNNLEKIPVLGQRLPASLIPLRYEGSISVETYPLVGKLSEIYSDWSVAASNTQPEGLDVHVGLGGGKVRELNNAVLSRMSISVREGEIVRTTLDFLFQGEALSAWSSSNAGIESGDPLTFASGQLKVGSNTIGLVNSADITINLNPNPIYVIGSRHFQDVYLKMFEAEGRITVVLPSSEVDWLSDIESVADLSSVVLSFNSGEETITLSGIVKMNELSHSVEPNEMIIADINLYAQNVTISKSSSSSS